MPFCVSESEYLNNIGLYDVVSGPHAECVSCRVGGLTQEGLGVSVDLSGGGLSMVARFDEVVSPGETTVLPIRTDQGGVYCFLLGTTAVYSGSFSLELKVPAMSEADFNNLVVIDETNHISPSDVTYSRDYPSLTIRAVFNPAVSALVISGGWPKLVVLGQERDVVCPGDRPERCHKQLATNLSDDILNTLIDALPDPTGIRNWLFGNSSLVYSVVDCLPKCEGVGNAIDLNTSAVVGGGVSCECKCPSGMDYCYDSRSPHGGGYQLYEMTCRSPCPPGTGDRTPQADDANVPGMPRTSCDCSCPTDIFGNTYKWSKCKQACLKQPPCPEDQVWDETICRCRLKDPGSMCYYCIYSVTSPCDSPTRCAEWGGGYISSLYVESYSYETPLRRWPRECDAGCTLISLPMEGGPYETNVSWCPAGPGTVGLEYLPCIE